MHTAKSVIPRAYDAVVVGCGVIGASTALALSRKGYRVCVVDKNRSPGEGTTSYSSGVCRTFYSIPDSVSFAWEGYQYWKNWEDFIAVKDSKGYAKLRECGAALLRSSNSNEFLDKTVRCLFGAGIAVEEWDSQTATERLGKIGWDLSHSYCPRRIDDPSFGIPVAGQRIQGAVYCKTVGYVSDPQLATQNLCLAAEHGGAQFKMQAAVVAVLQDRRRVVGVRLSDESIVHAPIVINAGGPYSSRINDLAFPNDVSSSVPNDMRVSTRPMRQEVAYTQAPPGVDLDKDGLITADLDVGAYWRPEVGNKLLIGGIEPACDPPDWFDGDPKDLNVNLTDDWTNYVYRAALRIPTLPIPSSRNMQGIVSLYDVTPDWTPIYDKSALGGYYMAIGTSGNQFKNAGVAGELMAKIIDSCENGHDHDNIPLQFETTLSNPGNHVNLRSFSRLRSANDTCGSVIG
ncbi:unnamed protein product [Ectocarpus fasciculatus]